MSKLKATAIRVCVYTSTSHTKIFQYGPDGDISGLNTGNMTEWENAAFNAANDAAFELKNKYKNLPINVWVCPYDYNNNIVSIEQQGFGQNLPAIEIIGEFPDTQKLYSLANTIGGKKEWTTQEVYNYMRGMAEGGKGGGSESIVCKILPVLCEVGAYVWLAAAVVSTYKVAELPDNKPVLKIGWTAASLLAWDAFFSGGGFEKLTGKK